MSKVGCKEEDQYAVSQTLGSSDERIWVEGLQEASWIFAVCQVHSVMQDDK